MRLYFAPACAEMSTSVASGCTPGIKFNVTHAYNEKNNWFILCRQSLEWKAVRMVSVLLQFDDPSGPVCHATYSKFSMQTQE